MERAAASVGCVGLNRVCWIGWQGGESGSMLKCGNLPMVGGAHSFPQVTLLLPTSPPPSSDYLHLICTFQHS